MCACKRSYGLWSATTYHNINNNQIKMPLNNFFVSCSFAYFNIAHPIPIPPHAFSLYSTLSLSHCRGFHIFLYLYLFAHIECSIVLKIPFDAQLDIKTTEYLPTITTIIHNSAEKYVRTYNIDQNFNCPLSVHRTDSVFNVLHFENRTIYVGRMKYFFHIKLIE